jgi:hypothetical protein
LSAAVHTKWREDLGSIFGPFSLFPRSSNNGTFMFFRRSRSTLQRQTQSALAIRRVV